MNAKESLNYPELRILMEEVNEEEKHDEEKQKEKKQEEEDNFFLKSKASIDKRSTFVEPDAEIVAKPLMTKK